MSERHVTVDMIVEAVCATTGLARRDVLSDRRTDEISQARFTVFWLAGKLTPLSSGALGRLIGGRDHSSVLFGVRRAEELRASDPGFRAATDALLNTLTALQRVGVLRLAEAVDPLATASRVLAAPDREAVRVSVSEIIALCRCVLDAHEAATPPSPNMEISHEQA